MFMEKKYLTEPYVRGGIFGILDCIPQIPIRGDQVFTIYQNRVYHFGIFLGDNKVAHRTRYDMGVITSVEDFSNNYRMWVIQHKPGACLDTEEVCNKAEKLVKEENVGVFDDNTNSCIHFSFLCKTGISIDPYSAVFYKFVASLESKL